MFVPATMESEIVFDKVRVLRAGVEPQSILVVEHSAVELRADKVEVLRDGDPFALADTHHSLHCCDGRRTIRSVDVQWNAR